MATQRKPTSIRHEGGQSLVIVILSMAVLLGIGALAIDISQWYAARHQAQITADSAALAAASCESSGQCTTNSAAQTIAISYAAMNGATITASNVTFPTSSSVEVTVPAQQGNFFSNAVHITAQTHSQSAVASWTGSSCTSGPCYAEFASSPTSTTGVDVTSNNATISGVIHSNCAVSNNGNNNTTFSGPVSYGNGAGCQLNQNGKGNPSGTQDSSSLCFPIDYSDLTANPSSCGGTDFSPGLSPTSALCTDTITASGTTAIPTGSNGYLTPGVYCYTSSTATAQISGSAQAGAGITVIAPNFSLSAAQTLYPYQSTGALANNQLVIYQYLSSWNGWTSTNGGCPGTSYTGTLKFNGNTSFNLNGYVFAPCAYADYQANNSTMTGFIEAYQILLEGGSFTGNGPSVGANGAVITGGDTLTQ